MKPTDWESLTDEEREAFEDELLVRATEIARRAAGLDRTAADDDTTECERLGADGPTAEAPPVG